MKGIFEFDIEEWAKERDAIVAKHDKGEYDADAMEKVLHYANAKTIEALCIRHYLFKCRMRYFFGRPDVRDNFDELLRVAAIDKLGLSINEARSFGYDDLVFMLRGEISRTALPDYVVDAILNDPKVNAAVFSRIVFKHVSARPTSRR